MKKILTSLLILLLSFAFFSCSDPSGGGSSDSVVDKPTGGTTTGGEGTGNSGGSSTAPEAAYLRINEDGTPNESGEYILFGEYPQTKVTDEATLSALGGYESNTWTSYGYYINKNVSDFMKYTDKTVNSTKYRGVYFTEYRPYLCTIPASADKSFQDDNGYTLSTVYWFKYDPIKWRILSEENGEALILCDMAIDSQEYDYKGESGYSNNYKESTIRTWLKDTFYSTAFSDMQKELIQDTTVDNSVASTGYESNEYANEYACENTNDKVFLLSYAEATNADYGLGTNTARVKKSTDYAKSQGCYTYNGGDEYDANCVWWLRSPKSEDASSAYGIIVNGTKAGFFVSTTSNAVLPALTLVF